MKTIQVQELFNIIPGEFSKFPDKKEPTNPDDIPVIGAGTDPSYVIGGYIDRKKCKRVFSANSLYITTDGVYCGSTFIYPFEFAGNIAMAILEPKVPMTLRQKMYYATAISANRKFFSYGRKMKGLRLATIEIPAPEEIPAWVEAVELLQQYTDQAKSDEKVELPPVSEWKQFKYTDLFEMTRGQGGKVSDAKQNPGKNPYVGASAENNGVTFWTSLKPTEAEGAITVSNNGSVGSAFYQEKPFLASSDVSVLRLKERPLNKQIGLFIVTIIEQEKAKYNYGRKWGLSRMKESFIALPVTAEGQPNYDLMERYINSLPYSDCL